MGVTAASNRWAIRGNGNSSASEAPADPMPYEPPRASLRSDVTRGRLPLMRVAGARQSGNGTCHSRGVNAPQTHLWQGKRWLPADKELVVSALDAIRQKPGA